MFWQAVPMPTRLCVLHVVMIISVACKGLSLHSSTPSSITIWLDSIHDIKLCIPCTHPVCPVSTRVMLRTAMLQSYISLTVYLPLHAFCFSDLSPSCPLPLLPQALDCVGTTGSVDSSHGGVPYQCGFCKDPLSAVVSCVCFIVRLCCWDNGRWAIGGSAHPLPVCVSIPAVSVRMPSVVWRWVRFPQVAVVTSEPLSLKFLCRVLVVCMNTYVIVCD